MGSASPDVINIPSSSSTVTIASSQMSFRSTKSIASYPSPPDPDAPSPMYRQARALPYELQEHCAIYFEEGLYSQALSFLTSLITAGAACRTQRPALLPPPYFLRLISTLTIHPTLTTRAKLADRLQAANLAHRYLRLVLKHAGPGQANLAEAFKYAGVGGRGLGRRRTTDISPDRDSVNSIENDLANSAALFAQAENFWQVVGWAFNCSVLHKRRWDRWSLWLEYMIEVLETDLEMWILEDRVGESMTVQYIISGGGPSDSGRKILRAVFADGHRTSVGEFKEIWHNETRELRKESDVKKAEAKIDIEADNYGDYLSDEDDEDFDSTSPKSAASTRSASPNKQQRQASANTEIPNAAARFGGTLSLHLRLRLLSLLSKIPHHHPAALTWSAEPSSPETLERLFHLILERIRHLPLPSFALFMNITPPFTADAASVLTQVLLHRSLIESDAPEPASYVLDTESLLASHLPWAASSTSAADNAKVSLCVETLLRMLDKFGGGVAWSEELEQVVEHGIRRREEKGKGVGKGRRGRKRKVGAGPTHEEEEDGMWLMESAKRLRLFVQLTKECNVATQATDQSEG